MGMKYTTIYALFKDDRKEDCYELPLENEISTSLKQNSRVFDTHRTVDSLAEAVGKCFSCWDLSAEDDDEDADDDGNFIELYCEGFGDSGYKKLKKVIGANNKPRTFSRIVLLVDRETYDADGHEFSWAVYDIPNKRYRGSVKKGSSPGENGQSIEDFMRSLAANDRW